jgi:hypothetical protein
MQSANTRVFPGMYNSVPFAEKIRQLRDIYPLSFKEVLQTLLDPAGIFPVQVHIPEKRVSGPSHCSIPGRQTPYPDRIDRGTKRFRCDRILLQYTDRMTFLHQGPGHTSGVRTNTPGSGVFAVYKGYFHAKAVFIVLNPDIALDRRAWHVYGYAL